MAAPLFFQISLGRVLERTRDGDGPYTEIQLYDSRFPHPGHQAAPPPSEAHNPVESAS
jgi:hypothetical protein